MLDLQWNTEARFYEEVAPCPDCNAQEIEYWVLGEKFRVMDPAAVREAMNR